MGYASGLAAQIGLAEETTVGTPVTVNRFLEFLEEGLAYETTRVEGAGLRAGSSYARASRTSIANFTASGDVKLEVPDKDFGLVLKHLLGSTATATQIGTTGAYEQIHTPGPKTGLGLTIQVGRPQTDGVVSAHTFTGCKITGGELSIEDGGILECSLDIDGMDESTATALATASYTASVGLFPFSDAAIFTKGGTVTTAAGVTSISGGTSLLADTVTKFSLKIDTKMNTDGYGLGSTGKKSEQLENEKPEITANLTARWADKATFYTPYKQNDTFALQLDLAHGSAGTGEAFRFSIILPAVQVTKAGAMVKGEDLLEQEVELKAYDDETNPVIQIRYVSSDTAI